MEHEEVQELSFDDLIINDDNSTEKPLEQIIKTTSSVAAKTHKINPTTGKPVFIHNLARPIKTAQNGNQIISRVIQKDNVASATVTTSVTSATNNANKKIIVLPAGKGQQVRVAGGNNTGNIQLVRSANNFVTLKGQVLKVVSSATASSTTSTSTVTSAQKGLPAGAIIIKNVNQVQKPSTSTVAVKPSPAAAVVPKNVVKISTKPSTSSSFQIKSVNQKPETTTPTKYTIVRNANGQQIKIIPHSQIVQKSNKGPNSVQIANIKLSPSKDSIIRSRPVPKEFLDRNTTAIKTELQKPIIDNHANSKPMVPPPPVNRIGTKKFVSGLNSIKQASDSELDEDQFENPQGTALFYDKKINIKKERSPSPEIGEIRRKHCNCSKSQCLKLYCDCFASGQFCQDCNCRDCSNNLEHEDDRQKAIRSCLERNPEAFKPKITASQRQSEIRLHNKGCNCKRSGCLKNYCECYEAKIPCSSNCKCVGCKNTDDCGGGRHFDSDMDGKMIPRKRGYDQQEIKTEMGEKQQPYNFITQEVIEASIQCMLAQAEDCKKSGKSVEETELRVIEEFGRCLVEIISFSIKTSGGI